MFSLTKRKPTARVMALADINSDGIHLALVRSEVGVSRPDIIWSHFEAFPRAHLERGNEQRLQSSVRSGILTLEMDGMRFLLQNFPDLHPEVFKVIVSAPLSETIARGLKFSGQIPVDITTDLMDEVYRSPLLNETPLPLPFGKKLDITTKTGSLVPLGQNLYQLISVLPATIYNEFVSAHDRFLPKTELSIEPRIGNYLNVISDLPHSTEHICLIDLTGSATELCVVLNGEIHNISHTPHGTDGIISKLAQSLGLPESEAEHLFRDNDVDGRGSLSDSKSALLADVFDGYEADLAKLLKDNDVDELPTTIFLHTEEGAQRFLRDRLFALDLWKARPTIHPITPKLLGQEIATNTPLLVAALLFHKKGR